MFFCAMWCQRGLRGLRALRFMVFKMGVNVYESSFRCWGETKLR
jgi:hypothetical protein